MKLRKERRGGLTRKRTSGKKIRKEHYNESYCNVGRNVGRTRREGWIWKECWEGTVGEDNFGRNVGKMISEGSWTNASEGTFTMKLHCNVSLEGSWTNTSEERRKEHLR